MSDLVTPAAPEGVRHQRAAALPPAARRAAIVAATIPLLLEHGRAVTTRQIAEAAGVAEGTLFRVFPDKEALIGAAVDAAFDPSGDGQALAAIDGRLPIEARLTLAVEILLRRAVRIWNLLSALGPPSGPASAEEAERQRVADLTPLAALFESEVTHLNLAPIKAAELLRAMTLAGCHPALISDDPMPPAQIVDLFLNGVRSCRRVGPTPRPENEA